LEERCGELVGAEGRCAQGLRIKNPSMTFSALDGQ